MSISEVIPHLPRHNRRDTLSAEQPMDSDRVARLVGHYPNVSAPEAAEILRFMRTARYVEIVRLTSDDRLRRQLDRFIADHRHRLRWSTADWVVLAALVPTILAVLLLVWNPFG
jgi:hypothetical protein